MIFAAQQQALQTNVTKAKIQGISANSKCQLCYEKDKTVSRLIGECPTLAQTDYKIRHDGMAKLVHWSLCKKYSLNIVAIEPRNVWIIDMIIPGDARAENKELEKLTKYKELTIETSRLWKKHTSVVPVVVRASGTISRHFTQ